MQKVKLKLEKVFLNHLGLQRSVRNARRDSSMPLAR